jgi:hypothetical protein
MSEKSDEFRDFEAQLIQMFDAPPAFVDADLFASTVTQRLDRGWQVRSLVIGGAGLIGGLIVVSQIMATNLIGKVESLSFGSEQPLLRSLIAYGEAHRVLPSLPFGGEGLWMSAGLAGLALVFALTRAIEEY